MQWTFGKSGTVCLCIKVSCDHGGYAFASTLGYCARDWMARRFSYCLSCFSVVGCGDCLDEMTCVFCGPIWVQQWGAGPEAITNWTC